MIEKVTITDNTNLPLRWAHELPVFANNTTFEFQPGVNIIVGPNGSGKSTLIKMMAMYFFCERTFSTQIPMEGFKMPKIFHENDEGLYDGIKIRADYMGVVYNYHSHSERDNDDIVGSADNIILHMDNVKASYGEQQSNTLQSLFERAFRNKNVQFPLDFMAKQTEAGNDYWKPRMKNLLKYYKDNAIKVTPETFEYTFLLDEPDRNLDISNIETLSAMLGFHKEMTQIIAVVHNPLLIYSLNRKKDVNFIEMEDGYLSSVINAVDSIVDGTSKSGGFKRRKYSRN